MRILVMSDIHANSTALEAVLKDAGSVDETWCLGDLVGYGPDPNLVLEMMPRNPQPDLYSRQPRRGSDRQAALRSLQWQRAALLNITSGC